MAIEVFAINGLTVSGAVLRLVAFQAAQGGNGIMMPDDLKVTALPVAGTSVRVNRGSSGGATLQSRYASAGAQAYATHLPDAFEDIPVPATGTGGGATRYVIQRVTDPQYAGQTAGAEFALISGSSGLAFPYDLGLAYPYVVLARIIQPASTATITQAMITDLRAMAVRNQIRDAISIYPSANNQMPTSAYSSWPILSAQRPSIWVPKWATKLLIVGHYSGIQFIKPAGNVGDTVAGIRTGFGAVAGQNGIIVENTAGRGHYTVVGNHDVLESQRGTFQLINVQAFRTVNTGIFEADNQSAIVIDYQLTAVPV